MIKKILIANRGEIAVRVIRAAREMGIRTVAVYSDADAEALHTSLADEAVPLGAPEPSLSYLDIGKIIAAAKATGADAIHPGYGFLSERAEFSEACRDAGITFIGPPPEAMRKLGAKIDAKQIAVAAGVPVTPGFFESGATDAQLKDAAIKIGFPVMLKASAGGGGRGMRIVRDIADFDSELKLASDEALKAFGDGEMMVEKLIERPRHIEVQVLADQHGNVACLFERECSIQRRHQKLIEEAPSPSAFARLGIWTAMREACRKLILEAGYVGAGTVEFMFDEADALFYFLEVNARLQVEHPVTEAITGLDLVEWQIRIAQGEKLEVNPRIQDGDRDAINGHAMEVRVIAEDPAKGFLPSIGRILGWAEPTGPGVRIDTGYGPGSEVSRYYDSMIAKVIVHAETREKAIARMISALEAFHVLGVKTNIAYILEVLANPRFVDGEFDTGFLGREMSDWRPSTELPRELQAIVDFAQPLGKRPTANPSSEGAWDAKDTFRVYSGK